MTFNGFNLSVRGYSHILKNTVCQDSSRCFFGDGFAVAAVSDGHGSPQHFRSDKGSEIAVRTAIRAVCDFAERNGELGKAVAANPEKTLRKIEANILLNWNEEIGAHYAFTPFSEREKNLLAEGGIPPEAAYGATLLVGVITETHVFGIQIGDGGFLMSLGGEIVFPVPDDLRLVANFTTSLCDGDAIGGFRHFCAPADCVDGVFLCSDGLVNSFAAESSYTCFAQRFFTSETDLDALRTHLSERSEKGSRDDISIAVVKTEKQQIAAL